MTKKKPTTKSSSTTIRVDSITHARLMKLAEELDLTLAATLREMATQFERRQGRKLAAQQLREMKCDPVAWAEFLGGPEEFPGVNIK